MDNKAAISYKAWLAKLDKLCNEAGEDRRDLAMLYSFQTAFNGGMTPEAALKDCIEWLNA